MAQILFPLFDSTTGDPDRQSTTTSLRPHRQPPRLLARRPPRRRPRPRHPRPRRPDLAAALAQARAVTPPDGLIIATGSVYLVGDIRHLALNPEASPA